MDDERAFIHFTFVPGQCIKDNRDGGSRLIIDVPECDAEAVNMLRRWRDKGMRAVVELDEGSVKQSVTEYGEIKGNIPARAKRKSQRKTAEKPGAN